MLPRHFATVIAGLALAVSLAACGSSGGGIPPDNAGRLDAMLSALESQVSLGNCSGADSTLARIKAGAAQLPSSDTRQGLQELVGNLEVQVSSACTQATTTTSSSTTSTTTEPTQTSTTESSTTESSTTDSTTTDTSSTDSTTTDEQPPPDGGGSGGTGPGSGGTAPRGGHDRGQEEGDE